MPALLLAILATHLVLTAQEVPKLDVEPACKAATSAAVRIGDRTSNACMQDENAAQAKLKQEWRTFSDSARSRCTRLSKVGGPPSYVELLTCLELAKAARELPNDHEDKQIER